ncbi:alpha/beta hydrolase family protein [Plantactinospora sp. GCM10030261]|uniref:alpha/beta hydrolase family protein n=1 Tax=Plantactinospora sp. GCM10030261 TaxID=3273420 RepID=UPI0036123D3C
MATLAVLLPGGVVRAEPPVTRQPAAEPAPPALALPAPTGRYPVGTRWLHLTDDSRPDPWRPDSRRELMVSLWYPALPGPGSPTTRGGPVPAPPAPYTTAAVSARIIAAERLPVSPDVLATVRVTARRDARMRPTARGWPLVILSPGFSLSRESLTGLAEDLASHGYLVAAVDHPGEAHGVEFPDGRLVGCLACEAAGPDTAPGIIAGRVADLAFVLDRLTGPRAAWPGGRLVDRTRVGVIGHSLGGATAVRMLSADQRVDAAANLDGTMFVPAGRIGEPVLLVGSDRAPDPTWSRDWTGLTGWKRWITVTGSGHMTFTDRPVLGAGLGLDTGPIPADRQLLLTRSYVRAFVDRHLRNRPAPLLDAPAAEFPEVVFRGIS